MARKAPRIPLPEDWPGHVKAGIIHVIARAQIALARSAGLRPTHLTTHLGAMVTRGDLVELYLRSGQETLAATKLAQKTVQLEPTARNYFLLSAACRQHGDLPTSLSAIDQALELDPHNPEYQQLRQSIQEDL